MHDTNQFKADMEVAGFETRPFPLHGGREVLVVEVEVDQLQDVIRATQVRVSFQTLGHGLVVFPKKP